jgi:3'-phosphoadenosine 5'-phosphosulfate sulfotransferase (PAPS reductase)/FAD synthetase
LKYVAVSGGADSTACALILWERNEDFEMVFADTGAELPETYFILPRLMRQVKKPLHIVSGGGFIKHLNKYGFMLPGPNCRYCTRILKQEPQDEYYKLVNAEVVCIGIRADEPQRLNIKQRYKSQKFEYPLDVAGLTKRDVHKLCKKYNLLNPVYKWRTNVSCFCCFFQRKSDWLGLLKNHPTLFAVAEEWERQSFITSNNAYSWNHYYKLEKLRKADEIQIKMWPEVKEEPCLICKL